MEEEEWWCWDVVDVVVDVVVDEDDAAGLLRPERKDDWLFPIIASFNLLNSIFFNVYLPIHMCISHVASFVVFVASAFVVVELWCMVWM